MTIYFFRERILEVVAAQAAFHVADRELLEKGRQGRGANRSGIPLDQDQAGPVFGQDSPHPQEGPGKDISQVLVGPHEVKVDIRLEVE